MWLCALLLCLPSSSDEIPCVIGLVDVVVSFIGAVILCSLIGLAACVADVAYVASFESYAAECFLGVVDLCILDGIPDVVVLCFLDDLAICVFDVAGVVSSGSDVVVCFLGVVDLVWSSFVLLVDLAVCVYDVEIKLVVCVCLYGMIAIVFENIFLFN